MKKAINVRTQEQCNKVMEIFEKKGGKWDTGNNPTELNTWDIYKENTCVLYDKNILYCNLEYYKENGYEIISFEEFLKEEGIEEKPKYRKVYVSDISVEDALEMEEERILITKLPGKAIYKYVCVDECFEKEFNDGGGYFTSTWSYIAEIPAIADEKKKINEYTLEQLQEKLGEDFKIIK